MRCVEYDYFATRIYFAPLPGALLSCDHKKVIKESTRGEALSFPLDYGYVSVLFSSEKEKPSPLDSSPDATALVVFAFLSLFVSLRDRILIPCPLGHTFMPHHGGVLHAAGASQPTFVGYLTPTAGGYFTRSTGAIN